MNTVEAIALDEQHLELIKPLPKYVGKRFFIKILFPIKERSHLLKQLKEAYLNLSEEDKKKEVDLAEEGLQIQPDLDEQFPGETEGQWWE